MNHSKFSTMKNIIIIIICFSIFTSCKKSLVEKPHSFLTPDNFYKTADDAQSALNGVFSTLQAQKFYQRTVYIISDLSGDIFYPNPISGDRGDIYSGAYTATNGEVTNWWVNCYGMIKNANDVITYVPGINMDSTARNNIVGNATFLRGLAYFDLVRTYGAVPLLLDAKNPELYPRRTSGDSIYQQVIKDLKYAEANCFHMARIPQVGMISSEAASAMLARVYLQRASTSFASTNDNQDALTECNKVISYSIANPSVLALSKSYADIFNPDKKNGVEIIFNVQFGASPNATNLTNRMFDPPSQGGYGSFVALDSYYNSFAPDDTIRRNVEVGAIDGVFHKISKYHDPGVKAGASGRNNWIVLRYADVLLMQSEAMNNIDPADINKFNGINAVRTRAGLAADLLSFDNTPGSSDFINALLNERKWELGVEGQGRWDLLRFKKYKETKALAGYNIDDNHLLMPVPQTELDLNPNLTQNPGY